MDSFFGDLIQQQKRRLFLLAREIRPSITEEDLLQPNDFPELEQCPHFRYEEGVLSGMMSVYSAFLAYKKDLVDF